LVLIARSNRVTTTFLIIFCTLRFLAMAKEGKIKESAKLLSFAFQICKLINFALNLLVQTIL
jgi:hypothetical protein